MSKKNRQHNGQKDKQRSTKHTYKTKDRVTRIQKINVHLLRDKPYLLSKFLSHKPLKKEVFMM
jgi:hypothetical protein